MYKILCRVFQVFMKVAMYMLPWYTPEIIEGSVSGSELISDMKKRDINRVLVVMGPHMLKRGLPLSMLENMAHMGIMYQVFDRITPDPTDAQVEDGVKLYNQIDGQGIVLFGGGSPMDCGKAIAARIARPSKPVKKLQGILRVHSRKRVPIMWAVPTTAGTGSETTMAAVITDIKKNRKKSINDVSIIPHICVFDASLTIGLPPDITAYTGMDALCHAVEAYTNSSYNTDLENHMAQRSVKLIHDNILGAYSDGTNLFYRKNMQTAAFYAGRAFTRGCVGYVHAIGHAIGGLYKIPHGKTMAILLPHVMRAYGKNAEKKLADLSDICGLSTDCEIPVSEKSQLFINWIESVNRKMSIPSGFDCIKEKDIQIIVRWALEEANPLYPVPKVFGKNQIIAVIRKVMLDNSIHADFI